MPGTMASVSNGNGSPTTTITPTAMGRAHHKGGGHGSADVLKTIKALSRPKLVTIHRVYEAYVAHLYGTRLSPSYYGVAPTEDEALTGDGSGSNKKGSGGNNSNPILSGQRIRFTNFVNAKDPNAEIAMLRAALSSTATEEATTYMLRLYDLEAEVNDTMNGLPLQLFVNLVVNVVFGKGANAAEAKLFNEALALRRSRVASTNNMLLSATSTAVNGTAAAAAVQAASSSTSHRVSALDFGLSEDVTYYATSASSSSAFNNNASASSHSLEDASSLLSPHELSIINRWAFSIATVTNDMLQHRIDRYKGHHGVGGRHTMTQSERRQELRNYNAAVTIPGNSNSGGPSAAGPATMDSEAGGGGGGEGGVTGSKAAPAVAPLLPNSSSSGENSSKDATATSTTLLPLDGTVNTPTAAAPKSPRGGGSTKKKAGSGSSPPNSPTSNSGGGKPPPPAFMANIPASTSATSQAALRAMARQHKLAEWEEENEAFAMGTAKHVLLQLTRRVPQIHDPNAPITDEVSAIMQSAIGFDLSNVNTNSRKKSSAHSSFYNGSSASTAAATESPSPMRKQQSGATLNSPRGGGGGRAKQQHGNAASGVFGLTATDLSMPSHSSSSPRNTNINNKKKSFTNNPFGGIASSSSTAPILTDITCRDSSNISMALSTFAPDSESWRVIANNYCVPWSYFVTYLIDSETMEMQTQEERIQYCRSLLPYAPFELAQRAMARYRHAQDDVAEANALLSLTLNTHQQRARSLSISGRESEGDGGDPHSKLLMGSIGRRSTIGASAAAGLNGDTKNGNNAANDDDGLMGGNDAAVALAEERALPNTIPLLYKHLHGRSASACAFNPSGTTIVTGGEDGLVKLWCASTGAYGDNIFNGGFAWVISLEFLASTSMTHFGGDLLAVVTSNNQITIINTSSDRRPIVHKYVGSSSVETAVSKVPVLSTLTIRKYGMRPGESGARAPDLTGVADVTRQQYVDDRREAQRRLAETVSTDGDAGNKFRGAHGSMPVRPIVGLSNVSVFVCLPEAYGVCVFGTADGTIGVVDLYGDATNNTNNPQSATRRFHKLAQRQQNGSSANNSTDETANAENDGGGDDGADGSNSTTSTAAFANAANTAGGNNNNRRNRHEITINKRSEGLVPLYMRRRAHSDVVTGFGYTARYNTVISVGLDGQVGILRLGTGVYMSLAKSIPTALSLSATTGEGNATALALMMGGGGGEVAASMMIPKPPAATGGTSSSSSATAEQQRPILGVCWCEHLQLFATYSSDRRIRLWNLLRADPAHVISPPLPCRAILSAAVTNLDHLAVLTIGSGRDESGGGGPTSSASHLLKQSSAATVGSQLEERNLVIIDLKSNRIIKMISLNAEGISNEGVVANDADFVELFKTATNARATGEGGSGADISRAILYDSSRSGGGVVRYCAQNDAIIVGLKAPIEIKAYVKKSSGSNNSNDNNHQQQQRSNTLVALGDHHNGSPPSSPFAASQSPTRRQYSVSAAGSLSGSPNPLLSTTATSNFLSATTTGGGGVGNRSLGATFTASSSSPFYYNNKIVIPTLHSKVPLQITLPKVSKEEEEEEEGKSDRDEKENDDGASSSSSFDVADETASECSSNEDAAGSKKKFKNNRRINKKKKGSPFATAPRHSKKKSMSRHTEEDNAYADFAPSDFVVTGPFTTTTTLSAATAPNNNGTNNNKMRSSSSGNKIPSPPPPPSNNSTNSSSTAPATATTKTITNSHGPHTVLLFNKLNKTLYAIDGKGIVGFDTRSGEVLVSGKASMEVPKLAHTFKAVAETISAKSAKVPNVDHSGRLLTPRGGGEFSPTASSTSPLLMATSPASAANGGAASPSPTTGSGVPSLPNIISGLNLSPRGGAHFGVASSGYGSATTIANNSGPSSARGMVKAGSAVAGTFLDAKAGRRHDGMAATSSTINNRTSGGGMGGGGRGANGNGIGGGSGGPNGSNGSDFTNPDGTNALEVAPMACWSSPRHYTLLYTPTRQGELIGWCPVTATAKTFFPLPVEVLGATARNLSKGVPAAEKEVSCIAQRGYLIAATVRNRLFLLRVDPSTGLPLALTAVGGGASLGGGGGGRGSIGGSTTAPLPSVDTSSSAMLFGKGGVAVMMAAATASPSSPAAHTSHHPSLPPRQQLSEEHIRIITVPSHTDATVTSLKIMRDDLIVCGMNDGVAVLVDLGKSSNAITSSSVSNLGGGGGRRRRGSVVAAGGGDGQSSSSLDASSPHRVPSAVAPTTTVLSSDAEAAVCSFINTKSGASTVKVMDQHQMMASMSGGGGRKMNNTSTPSGAHGSGAVIRIGGQSLYQQTLQRQQHEHAEEGDGGDHNHHHHHHGDFVVMPSPADAVEFVEVLNSRQQQAILLVLGSGKIVVYSARHGSIIFRFSVFPELSGHYNYDGTAASAATAASSFLPPIDESSSSRNLNGHISLALAAAADDDGGILITTTCVSGAEDRLFIGDKFGRLLIVAVPAVAKPSSGWASETRVVLQCQVASYGAPVTSIQICKEVPSPTEGFTELLLAVAAADDSVTLLSVVATNANANHTAAEDDEDADESSASQKTASSDDDGDEKGKADGVAPQPFSAASSSPLLPPFLRVRDGADIITIRRVGNFSTAASSSSASVASSSYHQQYPMPVRRGPMTSRWVLEDEATWSGEALLPLLKRTTTEGLMMNSNDGGVGSKHSNDSKKKGRGGQSPFGVFDEGSTNNNAMGNNASGGGHSKARRISFQVTAPEGSTAASGLAPNNSTSCSPQQQHLGTVGITPIASPTRTPMASPLTTPRTAALNGAGGGEGGAGPKKRISFLTATTEPLLTVMRNSLSQEGSNEGERDGVGEEEGKKRKKRSASDHSSIDADGDDAEEDDHSDAAEGGAAVILPSAPRRRKSLPRPYLLAKDGAEGSKPQPKSVLLKRKRRQETLAKRGECESLVRGGGDTAANDDGTAASASGTPRRSPSPPRQQQAGGGEVVGSSNNNNSNAPLVAIPPSLQVTEGMMARHMTRRLMRDPSGGGAHDDDELNAVSMTLTATATAALFNNTTTNSLSGTYNKNPIITGVPSSSPPAHTSAAAARGIAISLLPAGGGTHNSNAKFGGKSKSPPNAFPRRAAADDDAHTKKKQRRRSVSIVAGASPLPPIASSGGDGEEEEHDGEDPRVLSASTSTAAALNDTATTANDDDYATSRRRHQMKQQTAMTSGRGSSTLRDLASTTTTMASSWNQMTHYIAALPQLSDDEDDDGNEEGGEPPRSKSSSNESHQSNEHQKSTTKIPSPPTPTAVSSNHADEEEGGQLVVLARPVKGPSTTTTTAIAERRQQYGASRAQLMARAMQNMSADQSQYNSGDNGSMVGRSGGGPKIPSSTTNGLFASGNNNRGGTDDTDDNANSVTLDHLDLGIDGVGGGYVPTTQQLLSTTANRLTQYNANLADPRRLTFPPANRGSRGPGNGNDLNTNSTKSMFGASALSARNRNTDLIGELERAAASTTSSRENVFASIEAKANELIATETYKIGHGGGGDHYNSNGGHYTMNPAIEQEVNNALRIRGGGGGNGGGVGSVGSGGGHSARRGGGGDKPSILAKLAESEDRSVAKMPKPPKAMEYMRRARAAEDATRRRYQEYQKYSSSSANNAASATNHE